MNTVKVTTREQLKWMDDIIDNNARREAITLLGWMRRNNNG